MTARSLPRASARHYRRQAVLALGVLALHGALPVAAHGTFRCTADDADSHVIADVPTVAHAADGQLLYPPSADGLDVMTFTPRAWRPGVCSAAAGSTACFHALDDGARAEDSVVNFNGARLAGVAPGDISSADSREAVNGGQLHATNARVEAVAGLKDFMVVGPDLETSPLRAQAATIGVAVGIGTEAAMGATALGYWSKAWGENSVALGRGAYVVAAAPDSIAIGKTASVQAADGIAIGSASEVGKAALRSVALGVQSYASEADTVSIGNDLLKRRLVNIAPGVRAGEAVKFGQLRQAVELLGGGATLTGTGRLTPPMYSIQGRQLSTVGEALAALDGVGTRNGARVAQVERQLRAVFQDTPNGGFDQTGRLDLAGGQGRVLGNLADGRVAAGSRDAVNGGQLHALGEQLNGRIDGLEHAVGMPLPPLADAPVTATDTDTATATADAGRGATPPAPVARQTPADPPATVDTHQLDALLERANAYTDQVSTAVDRRLDRMDRRFNRMAAMNSAQSAMAMNTAGLATYNRLGAGIGHVEGEAAVAVGYQRVLNERGTSTISLHGAFTNSGERGVGVGMGIGW